MLDTGSEITTITGMDATTLDLSRLSHRDYWYEIGMDANRVKTIPLFNCEIFYEIDNCVYSELLEKVGVTEPSGIPNSLDFFNNPSVLGIDFVERFRIRFENDLMILENDKSPDLQH